MKKIQRKIHFYLWLLLLPLLLLLIFTALESALDPMPPVAIEQQQQGVALP